MRPSKLEQRLYNALYDLSTKVYIWGLTKGLETEMQAALDVLMHVRAISTPDPIQAVTEAEPERMTPEEAEQRNTDVRDDYNESKKYED